MTLGVMISADAQGYTASAAVSPLETGYGDQTALRVPWQGTGSRWEPSHEH